jgi:hypothetical protein
MQRLANLAAFVDITLPSLPHCDTHQAAARWSCTNIESIYMPQTTIRFRHTSLTSLYVPKP